jgi:hypothetical protein
MPNQDSKTKGDKLKISTMERHTRCSTCGRDASNMCNACQMHVYCNAACQKADWKEHKQVCAFEKELSSMMEDARSGKTLDHNGLDVRTKALWMLAP